MKEERIATPVKRSLVRNDTPPSLPRAAATPPLSGEASAAEGVGPYSEEARELLARADEALDDRPRSYGETILEREELSERMLRAYAHGICIFLFSARVLFRACLEGEGFDFWKAVHSFLYIYGKRAFL